MRLFCTRCLNDITCHFWWAASKQAKDNNKRQQQQHTKKLIWICMVGQMKRRKKNTMERFMHIKHMFWNDYTHFITRCYCYCYIILFSTSDIINGAHNCAVSVDYIFFAFLTLPDTIAKNGRIYSFISFRRNVSFLLFVALFVERNGNTRTIM